MFGSLGIVGRRGGGTPTISFSAPTITLPEGDSGTTAFTWTLTLNRAGLSGNVAYTWAVTGSGANPAAASDFVGGTLPSGSGTFTAGQTTKTITVNVAGDTAVESDEQFTVTVNATMTAALTSAVATGVIVNDDAATPGGTFNFSATTQSGLLALLMEDF